MVPVERTHHRQRHRFGQYVRGDLPDLLGGDRVDPGQQVVDGQQLGVEQFALAQPAHPRPGVLQAEDQGALDHAPATGDLVVGNVRQYELWLDSATLLPLKVVSRSANNEIIETVVMDDLRINVKMPDRLFDP